MLIRLLSSSRAIKRALSVLYDALMIPFAIYVSVYFRVGQLFDIWQKQLLVVIAVTIAITIFAFIKLGLYRAILRFMAHQAVLTVVACTVISACTLVVSAYFVQLQIKLPDQKIIELPRSTPFIYSCILLVALGVPRMFFRSLVHLFLANRNLSRKHNRQPIIIYGAGHSGYQIAGSLQEVGDYNVVAFIDDNPKLINNTVRGITVHPASAIEHIINMYDAKVVLLALGAASKSSTSKIVEQLSQYPLRIQTVPTLEDLLFNHPKHQRIRDIQIEDLLGRDPIPPRKDLLDKCTCQKSVMVTGAGGSIGSELCRQIIYQNPSYLILVEQNEFALYSIQQELLKLTSQAGSPISGSKIIPILINCLNQKEITATLKKYSIDTIFHAAAHKHVPLVEANIIEGVRNNVLGTWSCAQSAIEARVTNFVLISTDKAVRPTNVMGASKRVAELALQGLSQKTANTIFSMVRFGNVLGSSGSVVPLFKQQIKDGGPITVTHKNITRYFMTIPEAAQLVIQASAMAQKGDVFVLDMGEPVLIWELAERMIRMSGLSVKTPTSPNGDIEITQVGLRPGEKLYEELLIGENVSGTDHPLIMRAGEDHLNYEDTLKLIQKIDGFCQDGNEEQLLKIIAEAPTHYEASFRVERKQNQTQKNNIVKLPSARDGKKEEKS